MNIKKPIITEKTVQLAEVANKYTFEVSLTADKRSAARELSEMFGVKVEKVNTTTRLGEKTSFGKRRIPGRKADAKFMIFTLKKGDKIDLFTSK